MCKYPLCLFLFSCVCVCVYVCWRERESADVETVKGQCDAADKETVSPSNWSLGLQKWFHVIPTLWNGPIMCTICLQALSSSSDWVQVFRAGGWHCTPTIHWKDSALSVTTSGFWHGTTQQGEKMTLISSALWTCRWPAPTSTTLDTGENYIFIEDCRMCLCTVYECNCKELPSHVWP